MTTQNIYSLTDTWNSAGTTFTGIGLSVTDTASAAGSLLLDLQVGGTSQFKVAKNGIVTAPFLFSSQYMNASIAVQLTTDSATINLGVSSDLILTRDAADTLAQRRGTNAQAFRVYNTFTDASNYERGEISWSGNVLTLGTTAAGTGTGRPVLLRGSPLNFAVGGGPTTVWQINASGHFLAGTDNTYDIGASGATRPRDLYLGRNATLVGYVHPSYLRLGSASNEVHLYAAGDGIATLYNLAENGWNRLQFGGTTSSFPALRRNGTQLDVRLADDTGGATLTAAGLIANDAVTAYNATAIPAGGTTGAGLKVSSTANFGVFFGSGAPTLSAAKGSLYLRSDGTTTNDRAYINTDGATTWTALTTAA